MMKAAEAWERDDLPVLGRFHRPSSRRIPAERHVRPVRVVELRVLPNAPKEMTLAEHDQVIGQVPTERADKPFGISVLPRRSWRDANLSHAEVLDASVEGGAEDLVSVADEELERAVQTEGLDDLLRSPLRVRVCRDVDVQNEPSLER